MKRKIEGKVVSAINVRYTATATCALTHFIPRHL